MAKEKYLIVGIGQLGHSLLDALLEADKEVMVIDTNEDKIHEIQGKIRNALVLDATNAEVLKKLDLETFDVAVISLGEKFQNILLISVLLKEIGVKKIIARASTLLEEKLLKKIGVDLVVFPELEMGKKIANIILRKSVENAIPLADNISIIHIKIPAKYINKSLDEIELRKIHKITVVAIQTKGKANYITIIPDSDYKLKEDDILIIIGENKNIDNFINIK
ncbi:MAG: TrkA family potassium uptake protein [Bacteroidetes bacterium]|nr:TrkA family potassium uptake protein [Bacteroidota bacterium]